MPKLGKNEKMVSGNDNPVRQHDSIFQQDNARDNRIRTNTQVYDPVTARRQAIQYGIFGALAVGVFVILLSITIWRGIAATIYSSSFLHALLPRVIPRTIGGTLVALVTSIFFWLFLVIMGIAISLVKQYFDHQQKAANDTAEINSFADDSYPLTMAEQLQTFPIFPDAGAHSKSISPTSILSHVTLKNDARLPKFTVYDRDDNNELQYNADGSIKMKTVELFDEEQGHAIFETNGLPDIKDHHLYDPFNLKYKKKPGKKLKVVEPEPEGNWFTKWIIRLKRKFHKLFSKKGKPKTTKAKGKTSMKARLSSLKSVTGPSTAGWLTVGDFIKEDWYLPEYEPERPSGAFIVETASVNTFVIAITRGNKGQLWVNNTTDAWSREREPQNMFINDPKGEVYASSHDLFEMRGLEVMAFNLMDPVKTNQFNVLVPSIQAARKGDINMMQQGVLSLMESFFPVEKDGDPFWSQAEQTLVKMMVYSMIDYYVEQEREYIQFNAGQDPAIIAKNIDAMWGRVTMYNLYQMLTVMSRDKVKLNFDFYKDPIEFVLQNHDQYKAETGKTDPKNVFPTSFDITDPKTGEKYIVDKAAINDDGEELNKLEAFFKCMSILPSNALRETALQQENAMAMMADSEKTRATIYGMTLVAMLFFTEQPIARLTGASPSQSFDPVSLAFPRRLRFKFNSQFLRANRYDTQSVEFSAYHDDEFTQKYEGKDFYHRAIIDELGWVEYVFKGIFDDFEDHVETYTTVDDDMHVITREEHSQVAKPVYIKMTVKDSVSDLVMNNFYFEFDRGSMKTADGKYFATDPRTHQTIMKNGTIRGGELVADGFRQNGVEHKRFVRYTDLDNRRHMPGSGKVALPLQDESHNDIRVYPVDQTEAVYATRPKAIFAITPPHLASYIKIVLLIVSVFFSESVSKSYLTKENGKPFYLTRSMLDELGNMQVDGHGIENFQTKLSIGLGQGQQYTMVLQTVQQLKDVYGANKSLLICNV